MFLRDNEVKGVEALKDIARELFTGEKPSYGNRTLHQLSS